MTEPPARPEPRGTGCTHRWKASVELTDDGVGGVDVVTVVWCTAWCGVSRTAPGARVPTVGAPPDWIGWRPAL